MYVCIVNVDISLVNINISIISNDEDPSLRIESFAITNLPGVSAIQN